VTLPLGVALADSGASSSSHSGGLFLSGVAAGARPLQGTYVRDAARMVNGFPVYVRGPRTVAGTAAAEAGTEVAVVEAAGAAADATVGQPQAWLWWSEGRWRASDQLRLVGSATCDARSAPAGVKGFPDTPGMVFEFRCNGGGPICGSGVERWQASSGTAAASYPPDEAAPSTLAFASSHRFSSADGGDGYGGGSEPTLCRLARWQGCSNFQRGWFSGPRYSEAEALREDEDVYLLFLSSQRAAGLDLHFVTDLVTCL
jgi:hypothetical protein